MAGRHVLIDGYNVIRADAVLSGLEQRSLEEAREALQRSVASWPRFASDRVTIVFDGIGARSFASSIRHGHVTVVFPPPGASADDYIKMAAQQTRNPNSVVVVTNDSDIKTFCAGLGCSVTGSENLLGQLRSPHKVQRATHDDDNVYVGQVNGTSKKGNPRRLPKRLRGKHDIRF